jgi:hypothetical protein
VFIVEFKALDLRAYGILLSDHDLYMRIPIQYYSSDNKLLMMLENKLLELTQRLGVRQATIKSLTLRLLPRANSLYLLISLRDQHQEDSLGSQTPYQGGSFGPHLHQ